MTSEQNHSREHGDEHDSGTVDAVANAAQDIGDFIRSQRLSAKVSLRQLAERAGVSNPYLSQIERGLRKPSADVLSQIAKGLRVSAEVLYVRAGILEARPASPVRDALLADSSISERQKQMLLEIYDSFRRENPQDDVEQPPLVDGAPILPDGVIEALGADSAPPTP